MKKIFTVLFLTLSFGAFAQVKLGHINSADLLRLMPELDSAEQKLQAQSKEYQAVSQALKTEYENKVSEYQANQNQWTDLIKQMRVREIQDLEARIQDYIQNAEKDLEEQKNKLFNPIIEKAKAAIAEVAKEHKYSYIFDATGGMLLYTSESDDILSLVKKKLNLK